MNTYHINLDFHLPDSANLKNPVFFGRFMEAVLRTWGSPIDNRRLSWLLTGLALSLGGYITGTIDHEKQG